MQWQQQMFVPRATYAMWAVDRYDACTHARMRTPIADATAVCMYTATDPVVRILW